MKLRTVKLVKKVDVGLKQVVAPKTTTGTIIAEGLASHNSDYDHVVLCQTFGRMIDLPGEWPKYTMDIKQQCKMLGNPTLPDKTGQEHNALDDARWNKKAWEFLDSLKGSHHTEP